MLKVDHDLGSFKTQILTVFKEELAVDISDLVLVVLWYFIVSSLLNCVLCIVCVLRCCVSIYLLSFVFSALMYIYRILLSCVFCAALDVLSLFMVEFYVF